MDSIHVKYPREWGTMFLNEWGDVRETKDREPACHTCRITCIPVPYRALSQVFHV